MERNICLPDKRQRGRIFLQGVAFTGPSLVKGLVIFFVLKMKSPCRNRRGVRAGLLIQPPTHLPDPSIMNNPFCGANPLVVPPLKLGPGGLITCAYPFSPTSVAYHWPDRMTDPRPSYGKQHQPQSPRLLCLKDMYGQNLYQGLTQTRICSD